MALKNVNPLLTPDLLRALAAMGHGDRIAVVDANYPAHSAGAPVVALPGASATEAITAMLELLPLDNFGDEPVRYMAEASGAGRRPVHDEVQAIATEAEGRHVALRPVVREDFYLEVRNAFAVVATTETRPYGCFLLRKGVTPHIDPPVTE